MLYLINKALSIEVDVHTAVQQFGSSVLVDVGGLSLTGDNIELTTNLQ